MLSRVQLSGTLWTVALQGIFPTQGWSPILLHCRWIFYWKVLDGWAQVGQALALLFSPQGALELHPVTQHQNPCACLHVIITMINNVPGTVPSTFHVPWAGCSGKLTSRLSQQCKRFGRKTHLRQERRKGHRPCADLTKSQPPGEKLWSQDSPLEKSCSGQKYAGHSGSKKFNH